MFIITHDLEAALVCDKTAILREGKLLEFDTPHNLISSLPSNGLLARLTIEDLNEDKVEIIRNFEYCEKVSRAGNDIVEVFLKDFEDNLIHLLDYLLKHDLNITAMSRDVAHFRRYFQIRILEEEEREIRALQKKESLKGVEME
jgi:ABC-type multidrug transport system ATPase subunit